MKTGILFPMLAGKNPVESPFELDRDVPSAQEEKWTIGRVVVGLQLSAPHSKPLSATPSKTRRRWDIGRKS
jgi:hypothetical protein